MTVSDLNWAGTIAVCIERLIIQQRTGNTSIDVLNIKKYLFGLSLFVTIEQLLNKILFKHQPYRHKDDNVNIGQHHLHCTHYEIP